MKTLEVYKELNTIKYELIKELNGFSEDLDIEPYEGSIIEDLVIGYSIESKISLIEEVIEILELSKS